MSVNERGRALVRDFGIVRNWNLWNRSSKGGELNERNWSSLYPKADNSDKFQARPVNLSIRKPAGSALQSLEVIRPTLLLQGRRMSC